MSKILREQLLKLIRDNEGREVFRVFLLKIHSAETLDFYEDVETYKSLTREEDRRMKAWYIYNKYCAIGAEAEINVDERTKRLVSDRLHINRFQLSLFDDVQQYALELLSLEGFFRFSRTDEYKKFRDKNFPPSNEMLHVDLSSKSTLSAKSTTQLTHRTSEVQQKRNRPRKPLKCCFGII